jgi:hypothetical protein
LERLAGSAGLRDLLAAGEVDKIEPKHHHTVAQPHTAVHISYLPEHSVWSASDLEWTVTTSTECDLRKRVRVRACQRARARARMHRDENSFMFVALTDRMEFPTSKHSISPSGHVTQTSSSPSRYTPAASDSRTRSASLP